MSTTPDHATGSERPGDFNVTFAPDVAHAPALRALLRTWCKNNSISGDDAGDALLVGTELFTNAVNAGSVGSPVVVSVHLDTDAMILFVSNRGQTFDLASLPAPSIDRPGGRGLMITQAIGTVSVSHRKGTTTVSAVLPIRAKMPIR